jgi:hypothetical protein
MTGISQRAYARLRGVRLSAVQKAVATKRITPNADGTIDPERANEEWARNTFAGKTLHQATQQQQQQAAKPQAARQPPPRGGSSGMPGQPEVNDPIATYLRARAVSETFKARTAQLEYEERAGKLIQATKAGEYAANWSGIVGDALSAFADRVAPLVAAAKSEAEIHRILVGETNALRRNVAKAVADAGF